jgi:hypothetical protein
MNRFGFALAVLAVVTSAAWAYHINYRTKTTLGRVDQLRNEIAAEREAVEVLRVEWAYLNAPDRLAGLVAMHNDVYALEPMSPEVFDEVAVIPYPLRAAEPGSDGNDSEDQPAVTLVVTERTPLVVERVPMPAPRPVVWRLQ